MVERGRGCGGGTSTPRSDWVLRQSALVLTKPLDVVVRNQADGDPQEGLADPQAAKAVQP
jgi:hypothetical protein